MTRVWFVVRFVLMVILGRITVWAFLQGKIGLGLLDFAVAVVLFFWLLQEYSR